MNAALIIKWKLYLERLKKTRKISCEKFSFRRFRIRENMWWTRYRFLIFNVVYWLAYYYAHPVIKVDAEQQTWVSMTTS